MYLKEECHKLMLTQMFFHICRTSMLDDYGLTKLHIACMLLDVNAVERLLKNKSDVNARVSIPNEYNWRNVTPLQIILSSEYNFANYTMCKLDATGMEKRGGKYYV